MVPLSIRLILETDREQNAQKVLSRLKKLFDFVLRGSRHTPKVGLRRTLLPSWMMGRSQMWSSRNRSGAVVGQGLSHDCP